MASEGPILGWGNALKGFLSGGMIVGGLVAPYGILIQSFLVVAGFLIFLDSIFYSAIGYHTATALVSLIAGAIISYMVILASLAAQYLSLLVFIMLVVYIYRIARRG